MKKIKWGIIGLGNIANKFASAITQMSDSELFAVASRDKEKAEAFGNNYGVSTDKSYGTYEDLISDKEVEAIYIAVPHTLHKELSVKCLNAKKAVLCEKPVTISYEETKDVIAQAEKNKTFFMEAMKTRFLPVHQKVKEIISSGEIGEIKLIQADYGFYSEFDINNRLYNKELGGGSLLDVGIYPLSYGMWLLGNAPLSVKSSIFIGESGVDESVSAIISYNDNKELQIYSSIKLNTIREANIVGTKGSLKIPKFSNGEFLIKKMGDNEEKIHLPFKINGFEYQIQEVNNCLTNGKIESNIMPWSDSLAVMKILDEIKKGN